MEKTLFIKGYLTEKAVFAVGGTLDERPGERLGERLFPIDLSVKGKGFAGHGLAAEYDLDFAGGFSGQAFGQNVKRHLDIAGVIDVAVSVNVRVDDPAGRAGLGSLLCFLQPQAGKGRSA